jgi:hypothetical protein
MPGKNFVNQFKNTRRMAGRLGRRPTGTQERPRFGKNANDTGRSAKVPFAGRRPHGKPRPEK